MSIPVMLKSRSEIEEEIAQRVAGERVRLEQQAGLPLGQGGTPDGGIHA